MSESDALRVAQLLALQGVSSEEIFERTGVSEDEIEQELRRRSADAEGVSAEIEQQRKAARSDAQRRESAALLLTLDHVVSVTAPEPDDEPEDGDDLYVTFHDVAASWRFEDLVAESLVIVRDMRGVERVVHADREYFVVTGPTADAADVESRLRAFWHERLTALVG